MEPTADPGIAPRAEHHHREVTRGGLRAAVFGVSDGLVSNVGLVVGVAGAQPGAGVVRFAGLAGLIAGAVSMGAGEYNSMRVQRELFERELDIERRELHRNPNVETVELTQIYQGRGVPPDQAREMAETMMSDPERALEAHAREELGIAPDHLGSPAEAAVWSFGAFAVGALVPLLPWFFLEKGAAIITVLALAVVAAIGVGAGIARLTLRPPTKTALRQLAFTLVPAAVTYLIGHAVGVDGL
jgi:VIT1/CCC1 family predicted Fe2+/Mn2+ transporter